MEVTELVSDADAYRLGQLAHGRKLAIEVGTFTGNSAAALLYGGAEHLICVDTFQGSAGDDVTGAWAGTPELPIGILQRRLEPWLGRWTMIQGRSQDVALWFRDALADLVFLDAAHTYVEVLADIKAWYPKVRPGGILAGHDFDKKLLDIDPASIDPDYYDQEHVGGFHFGVAKAVLECFGVDNGIKLAPEADSSIWYVQKKDCSA